MKEIILKEILERIIKINHIVQNQISNAPNRFEEFECTKASMSYQELEHHDKNYDLHEKYIVGKLIEYQLYQHINQFFEDFLKERNILEKKNLTAHQKEEFKYRALQEFSNFLTKLKRTHKYFKNNETFISQVNEVEKYFYENIDDFIKQLCNGKKLSINDNDLSYRFEKNIKLSEYRSMIENQCGKETDFFFDGKSDSEAKEIIEKASIFTKGEYIKEFNIDSGYCSEYTALALIEMFNADIITGDIILEKIIVFYLDENGEVKDNHTFYGIRDKDSKLEDISSWNGIIYDPWNNLCCLTDNYNSLPFRYYSHRKGVKWESLKFTQADKNLKDNLTKINTYFKITGSNDVNKRRLLLIEEHQLTLITPDNFKNILAFLNDLIDKLRPDNFNYKVEFFITTTGNKLIDIIPGFDGPKIAIHSQFFQEDELGKLNFTIEELEFALASILLQIKKKGFNNNQITNSDQHYLDRLVINKHNNVQTAISYLRKASDFETKHEDDVSEIKFSNPIIASQGIPANFSQRIKNLYTFIAENNQKSKKNKEQSNQEEKQTVLPQEVTEEIDAIKRVIFYQKECDAFLEIPEKLNFLQSKLSDLTIELLPYELTNSIGIKTRDFCKILYQMQIDYSNSEHVKAVDELINHAYELAVPAFERIYLAIIHQSYNDYFLNNLRSLAFFKEIEDSIQKFVDSNSFESAMKYAEKLKLLREKYKNHFCSRLNFPANSLKHLRSFKQENNNLLPTDKNRYFGSFIGSCINFNSFTQRPDLTNQKPWLGHLQWAEKDDSHIIADTLWNLGITNDPEFFFILPEKKLLEYANIETDEKISRLSPEYEEFTSDDYANNILHFLSDNHLRKHNLNSEVFFKSNNFEDDFIQFYDSNWPALIIPESNKNRNINNKIVESLLTKFSDIAIHGSFEEKKIVKEFFLGRKDERDLYHLLYPSQISSNAILSYESPYIQFIFEQKYQLNQFKLFTVDEHIQLINNYTIYKNLISPQKWINIFDLPFKSLSIECLEQLIPLLIEKIPENQFILNEIILAHIEEYGTYNVLTEHAINLIKLINISLKNPIEKANILKKFTWDQIPDGNELNHLSLHDFILVYRSFDKQLLFPSFQKQESLSNILLQKIENLKNYDDKIKALEELIFVENKTTPPLSDIQFRNKLIKILVTTLVEKYGKDNQTNDYQNEMIKVIDHIYANAAQRDVTIILSNLANEIESQKCVTEHLGKLLEPEKYLLLDNQKKLDLAISSLASLSQAISEDKNDIIAFIEFISSPMTDKGISKFSTYLIQHNKLNKIAKQLGYGNEISEIEKKYSGTVALMLRTLYLQFWDLKLEERAVIMDHLLIPATKVKKAEDMKNAYDEAFLYVACKLFPNANINNDPKIKTDKDENFAFYLLKSYLDTADSYIRSFLLAGMLVATNQASENGEQPSVGKKLALLCEHLGPAYIKLAQAIHSNPNTPESIRSALEHVKSGADSPYRWQFWRLIEDLPKEDKNKISRIGALLGSASYNLALAAELSDGQNVVLRLLRENAEKNATDGFAHLRSTVQDCNHKDIKPIRESVLSIINEAERLSTIEMDRDKSDKQNLIASQLYDNLSVKVDVDQDAYEIKFLTSKVIKSGKRYRFIERVHGTEFNKLPNATEKDKSVRKAISKAILFVELNNILSGGHFDSDRHGNQLCYKDNIVGLFDFGEMSLEKPDIIEIQQLKIVLADSVTATIKNILFNTSFDTLLSEHIKHFQEIGQPTTYLMRVRKALLALRDFQKELTNEELIDVLKKVDRSNRIHPILQPHFSECVNSVELINNLYTGAKQKLGKISSFYYSIFSANDGNFSISDKKMPATESKKKPSCRIM